jgi:hypothetical protein
MSQSRTISRSVRACLVIFLPHTAREVDGDGQHKRQQSQHAELDHGVVEGGRHRAERPVALRRSVQVSKITTWIRRMVARFQQPGKARTPARVTVSKPARVQDFHQHKDEQKPLDDPEEGCGSAAIARRRPTPALPRLSAPARRPS